MNRFFITSHTIIYLLFIYSDFLCISTKTNDRITANSWQTGNLIRQDAIQAIATRSSGGGYPGGRRGNCTWGAAERRRKVAPFLSLASQRRGVGAGWRPACGQRGKWGQPAGQRDRSGQRGKRQGNEAAIKRTTDEASVCGHWTFS